MVIDELFRDNLVTAECQWCDGLSASESGADQTRASSRFRLTVSTIFWTPEEGRYCQPWVSTRGSSGTEFREQHSAIPSNTSLPHLHGAGRGGLPAPSGRG